MTSDLRDLVVFGCGSQALYVIDARRAACLPPPIALVDIEAGQLVGKSVGGISVRYDFARAIDSFRPDSQTALVAHGDNRLKLSIAEQLAKRGAKFVSAVHPRAGISALARLSEGCILCPGCEILPGAEIGPHAIIHAGVVVDHDCWIGAGANLAPGATLAGRVTVGEGAYVYAAAVVAPRVKIGAWAVIGAGAVVRHDVEPGSTVVGNPAQRLSKGI
jgi:sugar O-acyltransferase (sialic acid O-acetyltransferase NeuD family)